VAAVWVSPPAALACLAGVLPLVVGTRWYLRRAPAGYLWERAAYAKLAGTVGETVEGGRTIEALGLREEFVRRLDGDLDEAVRAEKRTLYLRTVWFPTAEFAYVLPVAAALAWGGWLVSAGHASIGEVTAIALYVAQLADPVDRLISWLDEIQVGATSFARLVGIAAVPPDRTAKDDLPRTNGSAPKTSVRLRRRARRAARHRPRSRTRRARRRRRAVRARANRRSAACSQASTRRGADASTSAASRLVDLPLEPCGRKSRSSRRSSTSFVGTLAREPPARPARRLGRPASQTHWRRSTHSTGPTHFQDELETVVGQAATPSRPPRRSRSRSHASCSPTRTRSCSTRPRRSSTRAPRVISSARSRPSCAGGRSSHRAPPAHGARCRPGRRRRGRPATRTRDARRARPQRQLVRALWDSWHGRSLARAAPSA
jgi:hypothetical protein